MLARPKVYTSNSEYRDLALEKVGYQKRKRENTKIALKAAQKINREDRDP